MHFSFEFFFAGTSKTANTIEDSDNESENGDPEEESMEDGDLSNDESISDADVEGSKIMDVAAEGEFVIVQYEGQKFPGKVTSVMSEGAVVSTLTKCKRIGWKFPQTKDEMLYEWDDIVQLRPKAIPLNNRNFFRFPDLEKMWGT